MASVQEKSKAMREVLTETILYLMEQKGLEWTREWNKEIFAPRNALSGAKYRGINRMNLATSAILQGYSDPRWVSALQAFNQGWHIPKGTHATLIEKWGSVQKE